MATLPTIESILFETYKEAGLNIIPEIGGQKLGTKQKDRFISRDLRLETYNQRYQEIVKELLDALGSEADHEVNFDLFGSLCEFHSVLSYLEGNVWTFGASEKQTLWTVLSICHIPWIARKAAFWRREIELAKDVPGGEFWYLPQMSPLKEDTLELPIQQICRWLLMCLGVKNAYSLTVTEAKGIAQEEDHDALDDTLETFKRSLYNWLGGAPLSTKSLNKYFSRDSELKVIITNMNGLETTWNSIRKRFLFARLTQEAYITMVDKLSSDNAYQCTDLSKNKALQLVELYKAIYTWTKESYSENKIFISDTEHLQADRKFIEQLNNHPRAFELNCFDPTSGLGDTSYTAKVITRLLKIQGESSELLDVTPWDDVSEEAIRNSSLALKSALKEESDNFKALLYSMHHDDEKTAISKCKHPKALIPFLSRNDIPWKLKHLIMKRLDSLNLNDWDQLQYIMTELSLYLNDHSQKNKRETLKRVEFLLTQVKKNPKAKAHNATIFQYEAKHLLSQNLFEAAIPLFEQALLACNENGFGSLKGEIARDYLAISTIDSNLGDKHEKLFRTIYYENTFESEQRTHSFSLRTDFLLNELSENSPPAFEDIAAQCADFFWDTLYHPYAGFERRTTGLEMKSDSLKELYDAIFNNEWDTLKAWIKEHSELATKRFKDVRGQTLLILLINMRHGLLQTIHKANSLGIAPNEDPEKVIKNIENAIQHLAELLPKRSVNTNDFKGQSPLILATDGHLADTVAILVFRKVNLNQQDFKGRTALHAAAATGSLECFTLLLEAGADPFIQTVDGLTTLHTAVRCGRPDMVKLLLNSYPKLARVKDHIGNTAQYYVDIYKAPKWEEFVKENSREMGTSEDYSKIKQFLESQEASELMQ